MASLTQTWHQVQVTFLEDLATAVGCTQSVVLPDGVVPDVARFNPRRSLLLLADAKDTETPGTSATQERLGAYVAWLVGHAAHPGRTSVLILCFRRRRDTSGWERHIGSLARIAHGEMTRSWATYFGPGLSVLGCVVEPAFLSSPPYFDRHGPERGCGRVRPEQAEWLSPSGWTHYRSAIAGRPPYPDLLASERG